MVEFGGHTYQLIIGDFTWWEAAEDAEKRGGHLATISSSDEFSKCASMAAEKGLVFLWMGAYVDSVEEWDDTVWYGTGEPFTYDAWLDGEPSGGNEYYLTMISVNGTWYFNDSANVVSDYSGRKGYILEKE